MSNCDDFKTIYSWKRFIHESVNWYRTYRVQHWKGLGLHKVFFPLLSMDYLNDDFHILLGTAWVSGQRSVHLYTESFSWERRLLCFRAAKCFVNNHILCINMNYLQPTEVFINITLPNMHSEYFPTKSSDLPINSDHISFLLNLHL